MRFTKRVLIVFISFLTLVVTSMTACGFLGFGNTAQWKEEVLLHDGSKIVVERWQKHGGRHEPGQKPGIKEQSITFTLPNTKKVITWKDEYSTDVGRSNFTAVALHIMNNTPYIITTPRLCLSYNKWGRPNPPYVVFKFESKKWQRISLSELPLEFQNVNLVITTSGDEDEIVRLGLVSADAVKEFNSSLIRDYKQYETIIRTPLKPDSLGVSCPDWSSTRYTSPKTPIEKHTETDRDNRK